MEPKEAFDGRGSLLFVDVREDFEWDAGHVEPSIHITLSELPERYEELRPDRPVVCLCQVGQRSEIAAAFLRERGYDAHNLEGGLARWSAEGLPLSAAKASSGEVVDGRAEYPDW